MRRPAFEIGGPPIESWDSDPGGTEARRCAVGERDAIPRRSATCATMRRMADLNFHEWPIEAFAIVAFALSVFNFLVSLWSIKNVRALNAKAADRPPTAS